jgi:hypothetical protein
MAGYLTRETLDRLMIRKLGEDGWRLAQSSTTSVPNIGCSKVGGLVCEAEYGRFQKKWHVSRHIQVLSNEE